MSTFTRLPLTVYTSKNSVEVSLKSKWILFTFLMHIPGLIVNDLSMLVILKIGVPIAQVVEHATWNTKVMGFDSWQMQELIKCKLYLQCNLSRFG